MPVKAEVEWNDLEIKSLHKKYKVTFDEDFKSVSSRLSEYRNSVFVIDRRVFLLYESLLETLIAVPTAAELADSVGATLLVGAERVQVPVIVADPLVVQV